MRTSNGGNHRIVNVLEEVPKRSQATAKQKLRDVAYAPTLKEAERRWLTFQRWARGDGLQRGAESIEEDWERMVICWVSETHRRRLPTTNLMELPFAAGSSGNRVDRGSAVDTGGVEIKTAEVKVDGVAEALAVTKAAR